MNFFPQHLLPCYDLLNLCVEFHDVNDLSGILLLYIGGDREVIVLLCDLVVGDELGHVVFVGALLVGGQDVVNVLLGEFIAVGDLYALFGSVDKEGGIFGF